MTTFLRLFLLSLAAVLVFAQQANIAPAVAPTTQTTQSMNPFVGYAENIVTSDTFINITGMIRHLTVNAAIVQTLSVPGWAGEIKVNGRIENVFVTGYVEKLEANHVANAVVTGTVKRWLAPMNGRPTGNGNIAAFA